MKFSPGAISLSLLLFVLSSSPVQATSQDQDFLRAYQAAQSSVRGTVIPIHSGVSPIIDHAAQVFIAPWIYAQYSNVQWIIGEEDSDWYSLRAKWKAVIENSPVVDLFLFNHGDMDIYGLERAQHLGWKKHQLRLLYTEGCGSASSDYFPKFLSIYNAAVAIGHRDTSASPFVSFPLIRFWTYGNSALEAAKIAWSIGSTEASIVDFLSFERFSHGLWNSHEEMLAGTVPGIAWTPEMAPDDLKIGEAAFVDRDTPEKQLWSLSFVDSFGKDVKTDSLSMSDSLFRPALAEGNSEGKEPIGTKHIVPVTKAVFVRDASDPYLGEAYRDAHGLLWGDAMKTRDGQPDYVLWNDAVNYCASLGARLPSAEEFERLSRELGLANPAISSPASPLALSSLYLLSSLMDAHYSPFLPDGKTQVLPHLAGNWFWTANNRTDGTALFFLGDSGGFSRTEQSGDFGNAVRCVISDGR